MILEDTELKRLFDAFMHIAPCVSFGGQTDRDAYIPFVYVGVTLYSTCVCVCVYI